MSSTAAEAKVIPVVQARLATNRQAAGCLASCPASGKLQAKGLAALAEPVPVRELPVQELPVQAAMRLAGATWVSDPVSYQR
jgi:hypothetical protein